MEHITENGAESCRHPDHERLLHAVRHELPTDEILCDLADLYRIFADSTRVKILFSLLDEELCVCCIAELLGMTQSAISHQLKILKDANLVGCTRRGKNIYYSLSDDHVHSLIVQGCEHLLEGRNEAKK